MRSNMQRDITITSHGCRLEATLYAPDLRKKVRKPTIIIVPGGNGRHWKRPDGTDFIGYDKLAEELAKSNFVVLAFDGRGQGTSEGIRTMDNMAEDLDAILNAIFEGKIPEFGLIERAMIGVLGVCFGGSVACRQLIDDKRVKSIAVYGAAISLKRCYFKTEEIIERWKNLKDQVGARVDFDTEIRLMEEGKYDLVNTLPELMQHVLVAYGTEDKDDRYEYDFTEYLSETVFLIREMKKARSVVFSMVNKGKHGVNYGEEAFPSFANLIKGWFFSTL